MGSFMAAFLVFLFSVHQLPYLFASPATAPAFLWYSHHIGLDSGIREVSYRIISPKDLAKVVISEGGWSNFVCFKDSIQQSVDIALVYIGKKLQSSDISRIRHVDPNLVNFVEDSFQNSNFSMAFPYVTMPEETETMENSFISGFTESCSHQLGLHDIAVLDSCSIGDVGHKKLANFNAIREYVASVMQTKTKGQTAMLLFCNGGFQSSEEFEQTKTEGEIFYELAGLLKQSGAKHAILYASNPFRSLQYSSTSTSKRFLAESVAGNQSTTCDGICLFKSSLLEGIFVGIVLLIILVSGLCCMMGIDTPTRFQAPHES